MTLFTTIYKTIGNALPVNLSRALAIAIKEQLFSPKVKKYSLPKGLESIARSNLQCQVKIKSPDNPVKRIAARLIEYQT